MQFDKWAESIRVGSTSEEDRIHVWVDRGYQRTYKDLPGMALMIPYKRSKNYWILITKQEHNRLANSTILNAPLGS